MKKWTKLAACAFAIAGCEELADANSQGPAVATMQGTLSLGPGMQPPKGELHLSILWRGPEVASDDGDAVCGPEELVQYHEETPVFEQKLELETDFPAAFSVKLTEPPPSSVLQPMPYSDEVAKAAFGEIVVYRDVNGNGRLDRRSLDQPSVDVVVGSGRGTTILREADSVHATIVYLTKDLRGEGSYVGARKAGYSLVLTGWEPGEDSLYLKSQQLNDKAHIELELNATHYVQRLTCEETCSVEDGSYCPSDLADLPPIQEQGEPALGDIASWNLELSEGDRTTFFSASCLRGNAGEMTGTPREVYYVTRSTQQGCTTTYSKCIYERSDLPEGAELPCTEFQDVVFSNNFFDEHDD